MFWIIRLILIGFCAGYIASELLGHQHYHYTEEFVIGVIGSFIGHFLFALIGLNSVSFIGELIIAVCGSYLYLLYRRK